MSAHTMYKLFCCMMKKQYYITVSSYSVATNISRGFPDISVGKESTCSEGDLDSIPRLEDPLEKGEATHFSILA